MKHNTYKRMMHLLCYLHIDCLLRLIPDELYLKLVYYLQNGKWLNISNPTYYNEKLQWIKLYDRNGRMPIFADKSKVKEVVADIMGDKYIIPTLMVTEDTYSIDFSKLPESFVIKCTHDSGSAVICMNKRDFNWRQAQRRLEFLLKQNYYWYLREWQYRDIQPRIIVEKYIGSYKSLPDEYKFFCFDGVPKIVMVVKGREKIAKSNFYDMEFNCLPLKIENPNFKERLNKPCNFSEMICIAKELSKGFRHVRIDLYNISGRIFFSEMTFQHWGGISRIEPNEWNKILGEWIPIF